MGRSSRLASREYLFREHQRLYRDYQQLLTAYEALPAPSGRFAAHHAHIRKVRQFAQLLANHRLAVKYRLDGLI